MSVLLEVVVLAAVYSLGAFNGREAAFKERAPFNAVPSNGLGVGP